MRRFYYLMSLLSVFILPTFVAYWYLQEKINLRALIPFVLLVTIIGSIWDIWATKHGSKDGVWLWHFNHRDTLGIRFFDLPIEEYLFYVSSSLYVIFMWEAFNLMVAGQQDVYPIVALLSAWTLLAIGLQYLFQRNKQSRE